MRCHGWRFWMAFVCALACVDVARAEDRSGNGDASARNVPVSRGRASRGASSRRGAQREEAAENSATSTPTQLPSMQDDAVEFVPTAAAMREAEWEARLSALEMFAEEKKKEEKKDDKGKDEKKKDDKKKDDKGEKPWYEVGSDLGMTASWKDGLEIATKNKDFRVHVGGRIQFDAAAFSADPNLYRGPGGVALPPSPAQLRDNGIGNTYGDGVDVRRARFRVDGTMYEQIDWAAEFDFVNSANFAGVTRTVTAPTDLWVQFKYIPVLQNIKIGNQKEAIGFEHMVSSRFQPFMERSYNQDTFYGGLYNGFTPGVAAFGTYGDDEVGTYNVGLFVPTNNVFAFNSGIGDYSVVGRLTRLLYWEDEGRNMLHIGGSFRQATLVSSNIGGNAVNSLRYQQYRTRDAIRAGLSGNWPTPANIILQGDDEQRANVELVGTRGSWTFQSEYLVNVVQNARQVAFASGLGTTAPVILGPVQPTTVYHGGYAQVLYYLTGEHDHYSKKTGTFERVVPYTNFFFVDTCCGRCSGWGAWQVGARYNYLCLNDGVNRGGILHDVTAGLNWFLNPNMKFQFNYMVTYRDAPFGPVGGVAHPGDGVVHGWGARMAWDF